jgi:hypothetical protein
VEKPVTLITFGRGNGISKKWGFKSHTGYSLKQADIFHPFNLKPDLVHF